MWLIWLMAGWRRARIFAAPATYADLAPQRIFRRSIISERSGRGKGRGLRR
jgi:hypothetical protein